MRAPPPAASSSGTRASLGDVVADVDVRPLSSTHDGAADGRCRNCGVDASGNFCANCGQSTTLHPPTVVEFLHEFLGHYVAFEGPLVRTLQALLLVPGRLTADYFVGRRQRYIPPLRLYLTVSLLLFALSSATGELRLGGDGARDAIKIEIPDHPSKDDVVIGLRAPREGSAARDWLERTSKRIAGMPPAERSARLRQAVYQYLPYVLIVLVPLLALIFKGVYWRRGRLYGEHLVVAFHAQTVAFLFAMLSRLPFGDWWGDTLVVALVVHGAIALRRVYGGRWGPTVVREALVLVVYSVVVGVAAALVATSSLVF